MAQQNPNQPSNPQPPSDNVVDFFNPGAQPWIPRVDLAVDSKPDEISRAIDVANATGADPGVVSENLEPAERTLKQDLSHRIVASDPYLQQYFNKHPIAPQLSSDDLAALSKAGDSYHQVASITGRPWWDIGASGVHRAFRMGGAQMVSAVGRMFGDEKLAGVANQVQQFLDKDDPVSEGDQERISYLVSEGLGSIASTIVAAAPAMASGLGLTVAAMGVAMGLQSAEQEAEKAIKADADWQTPFIGGFTIGGLTAKLPLGALDAVAGKAAPGVANWFLQRLKEAAISAGAFAGVSEAGAYATSLLERETFDPESRYHLDPKRLMANVIAGAILGPTVGAVKPFIDAGERIPYGAHPLTDAIMTEKTKLDNEALDKALKDAQATATQGRQPDYLATYYKFRPHATMGLDGPKVLELYGDKPPGPGDGILGDLVPDIAAQLKAARGDGSDIQVDLANYVAKVDPKIDDELHDFRRVDGDGQTLDEIKNQFQAPGTQEEREAPVSLAAPHMDGTLGGLARSGDQTLDAVRAQMGLDNILPKPAQRTFDFTPGRGLVPPGVKLDGPAITKTMYGEDYKVLAEVPSRDVLAQVDRKLIDGIPRTLYMFFQNRMAKIAGDVPVQIVSVEEMNRIHKEIFNVRGHVAPAFYINPMFGDTTPRIVMTDTLVNGMLGHKYAAMGIIHEMAHAASVIAMDRDPKLQSDLLKLKEDTLKWVQRNDPDQLNNPAIAYGLTNPHDPKGYEFVAQSYSWQDFQNLIAKVPMSKEVAELLGLPGPKTIWEGARQIIKRALEKILNVRIPSSIMDGMFTFGERFEAAADARKPDLQPYQEHISEGPITPEQIQLFEDYKTLGYTKAHWDNIQKQLEEKRMADNEFMRKKALKEAELRQSERWKQNAAEMRPSVEAKVLGRTAIRADRFLRLGILDGSKVTRVGLDRNSVDPRLLDQLSDEWFAKKKGGYKPDDIAGMIGYRSGDAMLSDLALMKSEMDKEGLTHDAFIKNRIEQQLDKQMRTKYGDLESQILEDAKDHVINDGQFNLLHEDYLRLATKFGFKAPLTKEQVKAMALDQLNDLRQGDFKSTRQADNTGRVGRKIEAAENRGDVETVMKLAQDRELSFYKTMLGRDFEKDVGKFAKVAKRQRLTEPAGFREPEAAAYHDAAQILLNDVGLPINRKPSDVVNEFGEKGFKSLREFVANRAKLDETIPAPEWILEGGHKKPFKDLTIGESKSFMNLVTALDKLGRERYTVNTDYGNAQVENILNQVANNLEKQYDLKGRTASGEREGRLSEVTKTLKYYIVSSRVMERILSRIDFDNPRGPLNQWVVRVVTEGMNNYETFKRTLGGRELRELGPPADLNKTLDAPFKVPSTQVAFTSFRRKELITIMLNMGNVENWTKFTNGWHVDPSALEAWVMTNATEADWKWVNSVWRIFDKAKVQLDKAYRNTTGTPPGTKEFREINTPFGKFEGGYYPLVHDRQEIGKGSRIVTYEVNDGPNLFQANIPNPHAQEVGKAEYPVSMNLDFLPAKFDQIIFDAAMREPLHQVKKILLDKKFRQDINNRMGKEYTEAIDSWLHDVSHSAEYNTAAGIQADKVSQFFRQNVIGYLVGANISTVLKHGPTALIMSIRQEPKYILKAYASLFKANPETGDSMWKWISENSEEIQRRDRFWQETFGGTYKDFTQSTIRDHIIQWGAKPVAFSDMLSAKPLWLAAFMRARDAGMDFGEARFEADRAVRFAHGSTAISNLPQIARGRGMGPWFTSLYGFFGTVLQNRMEIAYKLNDIYKLGREKELAKAAKILPLLAADVFAYVIAPTAIEEWVTGLTTDDRRGWGQHAVWATATGLANSFIGFRDLTHMLEYGLNDSGGLLSSAVKPFTKGFHDITRHDAFSKERAGDLIEDLLALAGPLAGVPKEAGNLAKYGWNTMVADKERPYTGLMENWHQYGDVGMGIFRGKQKKTVVK